MKMKKKRLLGILLSLALMLGLLPGMSLTAFANEHTHNFEYSASGDTITATCQNGGCNLTDNKVTLTIKAPENLYYNDTTASHAATLENLDAFNAATGRTYSADKIVYYKGGSTTSISSPKMATYTAKIAINPNAGAGHSDLATAGKFASVTFTFIAKPVEHTHSFSYTANGAVITATCTSTTGTCDLTNKQATLTLNAPEHTLYGDGKNANATFTGEIPGVNNLTINYRKSDTPLNSAPTDAGTYTAWCQVGSATARVEYTIGKANNSGWTNLPQAKTDLVYTTEPQDLITAGVPSAGTALYTVGTDPDNEPNVDAGGMPYSASVPKMTNAGTYYVLCKIDGGKNYTSINAQKVKVTIARANITPSVSIVGWTYGQTANTPMVGDTDNPGNGEVTYTYKVKDADDSTYTSTVPTKAGNYTVKAVIAETANYNSGVATKDFTISKAALTVTAKDQNISVGDEVPDLSSPVLDTHYTVTGLVGEDKLTTAPALAYQKNGSAATPDNTALGTYDIVASGASAGDNYTISYTNGTLTVEKGKAVAATVTANNRTYDGTEKPLVTVDNSTLVGGEMWYVLGENATTAPADNLYTTSIPSKTDAGTYTVYYKVVGGDNYADVSAKSLNVKIAKADSSIKTVPTAKSLTYTGGAQELVNAGEAFGGTIEYSTDNKSYSTTIPTATNAGTYAVYYKVVGDANHNDVAARSINVTVSKAETTIVSAPTSKVLVYTGNAQELINAGKAVGGTIKYSLGGKNFSTSIPTGISAGTYTVYYKVVGDADHNDTAAKSIEVIISKANSSITTAPTAKDLTYTGKAQELVNAGKVSGGSLEYSTDKNNYSAAIPMAVNAGTYTVYYRVIGDNNHSDIAEKSIQVTISKIDPTVTAPKAKTPTYTGKSLYLVKAGTTTGGTMMYCLTKSGTYTKNIPTAKNVGTYKVYYKVDGGVNYNSTAVKYVTVKINPKAIAIKSLKNSASKTLLVKWSKNSKATGYQIQYSTSSKFKSAKTVTIIKNSTVSKKITKLTKGKTYYVRVRTYKTVSKVKYYSAWSAGKKCKVAK